MPHPEQVIESLSIHRFNEWIAFNTQSSETFYLTSAMAKRFARELHVYATNIDCVDFTNSSLGTRQI